MRQLSEQQIALLKPRSATLKIICLVLIGGLLFATVLFCLMTDWQNISTELSLLPLLGVGFGLGSIVASLIVPSMMAANLTDHQSSAFTDELMPIFALFQSKTIIRYALLEGAGFFNALMFRIENNCMSLGVVAVLLSIMLLTIPSENKIISWIEEKLPDGK